MALKGNLCDFSVTQLLNLISLAKKTGTLVLESQADAAWLSFRDGKLAYARLGQEDNSLVSILYNSKKITAAQFRIIKERSSSMNDKELGLLLVNANYLTQQDVLNSLNAYINGVVSRLFTWVEGVFRFDSEALPPEDKITLRINLENLIIDGARRVKELERLKEEIPSLDIALKFTDRPDANIRNLSLSAEEWRVVSFINPKNSLKQIAHAAKMTEIEIRRVSYGLLQAGVVELIRPEGAVPIRPVVAGIPNASKSEQVSLLNRIIKRIRSL